MNIRSLATAVAIGLAMAVASPPAAAKKPPKPPDECKSLEGKEKHACELARHCQQKPNDKKCNPKSKK